MEEIDVNTLSFEEKIGLLSKLSDTLKEAVMPTVDAYKDAANSKMAFKVFSLKEPLLYRMSDLTSSAVQMYSDNKILPGFLLTRASMETFVVLFSLRRIITNLVKNKNIVDADNLLMKRIFGGKAEDMPLNATNIMTLIAPANKEFPNFKSMYDYLSEICHPNLFGVHMLYSAYDNNNLCLALGFNPQKVPIDSGLNTHIRVTSDFVFCYNDINNYLEDFMKVCNADIDFEKNYRKSDTSN